MQASHRGGRLGECNLDRPSSPHADVQPSASAEGGATMTNRRPAERARRGAATAARERGRGGQERGRDEDRTRDRGPGAGHDRAREERRESGRARNERRSLGGGRQVERAERRREEEASPDYERRGNEAAPSLATRDRSRHARRSHRGRVIGSNEGSHVVDSVPENDDDVRYDTERHREARREKPRSPVRGRSHTYTAIQEGRRARNRELLPEETEDGRSTSSRDETHSYTTESYSRDYHQVRPIDSERVGSRIQSYRGERPRSPLHSKRHTSKKGLPRLLGRKSTARDYTLQRLKDYKADRLDFLVSPSRIWRRVPVFARLMLTLAGFVLIYYMLFYQHDWQDQFLDDHGNILPLNETSRTLFNKKRPPPIWHNVPVAEFIREPMSPARKMELEKLKNEAAGIDELAVPQATTPPPTTVATSATTTAGKASDGDQKAAGGAGRRSAAAPSSRSPRKPKPSTTSGVAATQAVSTTTKVTTTTSKRTSQTTNTIDSTTLSSAKGKATKGPQVEKEVKPKTSVDQHPKPHNTSKAGAPADAEGIPPAAVSSGGSSGESAEIQGKSKPSSSTPGSQNVTSQGSGLFANLNPRVVPPGEIPVLHWNYDKVLDPGTAKQVFALGYNDHVAAFKPLCITSDNKIFTPTQPRVCGGFNRTDGWMIQYCDTVEQSYDKESNLEKQNDYTDKWLHDQDAAKQVFWIEGLTILQILEKNCGNIAHFAGRALMLQHVMENIQAYAAGPTEIENVLIVPTFHIMKRFLYPHNYAFWHKTLMRALVAPAKYTIGTLGNFLYRTGKNPYDGVPRIQLLHNFSLQGSNIEDGKVVCFRRAIVPGYLKDRYFVDDMEYPSGKPSLQSALQGAPRIPRDSLRLREQVSALLHESVEYPRMTKTIVFLDRGGERRKIAADVKEKLLSELTKAAKKRSFELRVVAFDDMTFKEQVASVETAGIAVGVHGANLVNAMFMPPLSALIELFPYQFHHGMYEEGGKAGLKYFSYTMLNGAKFETKKRYKSVEACIKLSNECKVFYRDQELKPSPQDFKGIVGKLGEAMDWYDAVAKKSREPKNTAKSAKSVQSSMESDKSLPQDDKGETGKSKTRRRRRVRRRRLANEIVSGKGKQLPNRFSFKGRKPRRRPR